MKLLVLTSTLPGKHNETDPRFVLDLCLNLSRQGMEIDILTPHVNDQPLQENISGITIYRYRYFFSGFEKLTSGNGILPNLKKHKAYYFLVPFFLFGQVIAAYKLIKKNNYDFVHAHWLIPQGLIASLLKIAPFIQCPPVLCTIHGSDIVKLDTYVLNIFKRWIIENVDAITLVSKSLQYYLDQLGANHNNIQVCPMGVDLKGCFTIQKKPEERNPLSLIFVGRLIHQKGILELIEVIRDLYKNYPKIELNIIGEGDLSERINNYIKEEGLEKNIILHGAKTPQQVAQLLNQSSIFVMPSTINEGFGLVTIEAMGCGCAVLASDLPSSREIIQHETNGLLFKPSDMTDMARQVERLILNNNLKEQIVTQARQSAVEQYDWTAISSKYFSYITDLYSK